MSFMIKRSDEKLTWMLEYLTADELGLFLSALDDVGREFFPSPVCKWSSLEFADSSGFIFSPLSFVNTVVVVGEKKILLSVIQAGIFATNTALNVLYSTHKSKNFLDAIEAIRKHVLIRKDGKNGYVGLS